jgi:hypothetical protein
MGLFKKMFGNSQKPEDAKNDSIPIKEGSDNTRFNNAAANPLNATAAPDAKLSMNKETQPWRTFSIFISSTFADMQAERDHLKIVIFPAMEEELHKRIQNHKSLCNFIAYRKLFMNYI